MTVFPLLSVVSTVPIDRSSGVFISSLAPRVSNESFWDAFSTPNAPASS